jgi:hypothetical protein
MEILTVLRICKELERGYRRRRVAKLDEDLERQNKRYGILED